MIVGSGKLNDFADGAKEAKRVAYLEKCEETRVAAVKVATAKSR